MSELAVIEHNFIVAAFQQPQGVDVLFDRIAEQARSFVPDVTTKKGRDAIGTNAAKVSKSKVLVEAYAKDLVAEQKKQIKLVDDDRISFVKKMDALRDEILAPRDAFIKAEEDRVAAHEYSIYCIRGNCDPSVLADLCSKSIMVQIEAVEKTVVDASFEEFEEAAKLAKLETLDTLRKALATQEVREAEQAELERLRAEAVERQRIEHEQRIAEQAAAKARAEAETIAHAERDAAEQARINAERKAESDRVAAEREQARLVAETEAAVLREQAAKQAAVEAARQAEIDKAAAVEAERQRMEREAQDLKAQAEREEQQRIANRNHVRKINCDALAALLSSGITEEQGKQIIKLIAARKVPNISIQY